jgi:nitroreductase
MAARPAQGAHRVTEPTAPRPQFELLAQYVEHPVDEMRRRVAEFLAEVRRRRSVRDFSPRPIPRDIIERALLAAGTAPSGANMQPWHLVVVTDPDLKRRIREGAEEEERAFYRGRAPREWLDALAPLGTDEHKPFLEVAPCVIVVFALSYGVLPDGRKVKNYYVQESVGIAVGLLIAALHHAGLATLTHTPSPMGFLNEILGRPTNERPYLLLVTGYPAAGARVPVAGGRKKTLAEIATFM